jgi:hypothetical protein
MRHPTIIAHMPPGNQQMPTLTGPRRPRREAWANAREAVSAVHRVEQDLFPERIVVVLVSREPINLELPP